MSGLFALFPIRMSTPFSPPLRAASRLSSRNLLFGLSAPWHRRQEVSRIGFMSRAKSICVAAGGGSFDSSTAVAEANGREERENNRTPSPLACHSEPAWFAAKFRSALALLDLIHRPFQ